MTIFFGHQICYESHSTSSTFCTIRIFYCFIVPEEHSIASYKIDGFLLTNLMSSSISDILSCCFGLFYFVCLVFFLMVWFFLCRNLDMEAANFLWLSLKKSITGIMFGLTISDKFFTVYSVTGSSMHPTFTTSNGSFPAFLKGMCIHVKD